MKTIRWGIIGAGKISTSFATALKSLENTTVAAIASRDLSRAEEFADKFQINKAYGSYEELAKDPEIDVVYIGTPHSEHKDHTALCIEHGKAVLCEKSFTINHKETEYLISLAKEKEVFLMEAMWTKFLPATKVVEQWLREEKIGKIKHFKVSFGYQAKFDKNDRLFNKNIAGGALLDVGVYPITYMIHFMKRLPDQIFSSAVFGSTGVDEQNVMIFQYDKEGILGDLSSSVTTEVGKDAYIIGDKGTIHVPNFWMADRAELYDGEGNLCESYSVPFAANGYEYEAEEVNRCLREGKLESDVVPLRDTLEIMKVMDKIRNQWGFVYPQEK